VKKSAREGWEGIPFDGVAGCADEVGEGVRTVTAVMVQVEVVLAEKW
jgi:hypothetical protein